MIAASMKRTCVWSSMSARYSLITYKLTTHGLVWTYLSKTKSGKPNQFGPFGGTNRDGFVISLSLREKNIVWIGC